MRGRHHLHLRKRQEPFPATTWWKRALDQVVLAIGIIGPLMTLPQILKVYMAQDASDIAALSWGTWAILDIPWILYGLTHRELPIIATYTLWFFANAALVVAAYMYGGSLL